MEVDGSGPGSSDLPARHELDEKIAAPLAYLRGLMAGGKEAAGVSWGNAGRQAAERDACPDDAGAMSVMRRLEADLGIRPALDLAAAGPADAGADPAAELKLTEKRYVVEGEIASGGMGRIIDVYDQDIRRRVAMKVMIPDLGSRRQVARFLEEAQATGQLEHPNIAPVYDLGIDPKLGVYFTMKLVRGRNLKEIVGDLAAGKQETRRRFTLTRLLQILQGVAMGVHYAHARGVVHRDLKPDNVMVGEFGEVLVLDWGLAKIRGSSVEAPGGGEYVHSHRRASGEHTLDGTVSGTLAYMSPEQARGWVDAIDQRTDVFGLGAILYEILTHQPPYFGSDPQEVLARAGACEIVPPSLRAPRNYIPPSLEEICRKALAPAREDRHSDALAFHEEIQVFLDGTLEAGRRRKEAGGLARQGRARAREYKRLAGTEAALRLKAAEELLVFKPHDPDHLKAAGWRLEEEAADRRQERIQVFNEATALLHSAINVDGNCRAAKAALADLYWQRFEEAERSGNGDDMLIYRGLVERYHGGKFTRLLEGKGKLTVDTEPGGAQVILARVVERGRRREEPENGGEPVGESPLELEIPIGHYLVILRREGCRDTRYPFFMERCGKHHARVTLYRDEDIGAGFVHVPAGECVIGGDLAAPGSLPLARRYIGDLFVGEYPVTFREYCRFLDDLRAGGDARLEEWMPRAEKEGDLVRPGPDGRYEPAVELLDIDRATRARYPPGFERELPVFAVSWFAAARYVEWLSALSGRRVRLLRDSEWEKAARGVSRVLHPWGDRFDWSFVKGGLSRPERAQPEPAGAFPADASIYGVRDLAGSIREWCEDWFLEGKYRLTRGGGWYSIHEGAFRAAYRQGTNPSIRSSLIGFRVAAEPRRRGGS